MEHRSAFLLLGLAALVALLVTIYQPVLFPGERLVPPVLPTEDAMARPRVLTFCSDPWPPYAGTAGTASEGYVVDLLRAIFEPQGFEVRYSSMAWSRCIQETRDGRFLGLLCCERHETPDFTFPQEPVGITSPSFFTLPDSTWTWQGTPSLDLIRLGMVQDYYYCDALEEYVREHRHSARVVLTQGTEALERLLGLLETGTIDAFVENGVVVDHLLASQASPTRRLRCAGRIEPGGILYVGFSPRDPRSHDISRRFDEGMRRLRQDGTLARILARAGVADWLSSATVSP
ncbi:MAG: ABC-type amino acid transport/signal transduction system [Candidatus Ozemobacter sibiricus]|jgi:polar amino acid transport system substrate-binding protein|uniref:ABC-type amino acid transport/signal transduction system n=1 Tax=Candidatus Ozemobacter sibiricus TaxID=2268124 RepID=A0A367ZUP5_9BACT|nr:MAG: ABC-type amino acid transport/signal transduction system [Candidatus Ozemobacter sibiricus]